MDHPLRLSRSSATCIGQGNTQTVALQDGARGGVVQALQVFALQRSSLVSYDPNKAIPEARNEHGPRWEAAESMCRLGYGGEKGSSAAAKRLGMWLARGATRGLRPRAFSRISPGVRFALNTPCWYPRVSPRRSRGSTSTKSLRQRSPSQHIGNRPSTLTSSTFAPTSGRRNRSQKAESGGSPRPANVQQMVVSTLKYHGATHRSERGVENQ